MEDNPSVIECQHIARLASVRWCQCICTHSAAWRVLLCPVRSMLAGGGGLRPQQRPHADPARPHNPWSRGDILSRRIFIQIKTRFTTSCFTHMDHLCDIRMSLDIELCPEHWLWPHTGDGSEWSVECGVSPPEAAEARGGRASPGPCDQSLLSPPSLLTITISHHRTPGGHGQDMVRTSDQHQQGNNSVINYTQPAPASREPDVTHLWPGAPHDSSSSLSSSLSLLQCSFCGKAREHDDIWGEVFPSIIGSVYQSVWLVVMFAPIPLSLIFIKLFWAHSQKIKNEHFLMEMYILYFWL